MTFQPTEEQQAIARLYATRDDVIVEAGAGAGKTSTIRYLTQQDPREVQYLAFNRALVNDAAGSMPKNVSCRTAHSLAFGAVGKRFKARLDSSQRMRSRDIAYHLRISRFPFRYGQAAKALEAPRLAGITMRALERFCQSADPEPTRDHFPYVPGIDEPRPDGRRGWTNNLALRAHLLPALRRAWVDAQNVHGVLPYKHSYYLKLAQIEGMQIRRPVIVIDEAQDLSPVLLAIVEQQRHAQIVLVGDSAQAIYGFTGAVDALARAREMNADAQRGQLSQSFRFGPAIAEVANVILGWLESDLQLKGLPSIESSVERVPQPHAILTRTNAVAVQEVLTAIEAGRHPHLVGGGDEVVHFAYAANEMKEGRLPFMYDGGPLHPDLACFDDWSDVRAYVEQDEQGGELRLLVKLVEEFGAQVIIDALGKMPPERDADLVVSTAHKSKGREWPTVRLGPDFPEVGEGGAGGDIDELRLLYVACTRARNLLDVEAVPGLLEELGMSATEPVQLDGVMAGGVVSEDDIRRHLTMRPEELAALEADRT